MPSAPQPGEPFRRASVPRTRTPPPSCSRSAVCRSPSAASTRSSDVDLEVREGELVGLIGPNGAGKTTLIDAVTGFVPFTGSVSLDGEDIGALPAYQRARRGLARTWQNTDLFDDLEVGENVAVAGGQADRTLGWSVSTGQPRRCPTSSRRDSASSWASPARSPAGRGCCAWTSPPPDSTRARARNSASRCAPSPTRGQSTLLIDHDMGLVLGICDRVVVLEFGRVIADGPPEIVRQDERVIAAYLGGGAGGVQIKETTR